MSFNDQIKQREHPIITAKKKSMNLTSVVESQDAQVRETRTLLKLAVKTDRKVERPFESIAYHNGTGGSKPRIARPRIPDTWGQEPTRPLERDITVVRSASRDHPYTSSKKVNVVRSAKIPIKLQRTMKSTNGARSTDLNTEVRIIPEDEFNKLNEEKVNKIHQAETAVPCVGATISIQDEEELTAGMVSLYPSQGNLTQASDYEIGNSVSHDLSVVKPTLLVLTHSHENLTQHHSNTSNGSFFLQVRNEPSLKEIPKIIRSLQHVPLYEEEFEPKPGSSKAPDLDVFRKLESFDSLSNAIEMTKPTEPSEMSDVKSRGSNASQADDDITCELASFSLPHSDGTSSDNSRVVAFAYAQPEAPGETLRKTSSQFASSKNEHKVILDEATSSSTGRVSTASESVQDITEELPKSIAPSSSVGLSIIEPLKISPIGSDSSSIAAFAISFKGSSLPTFLPVSSTPVSKIKSPTTVQLSKVEPTRAANDTVGVQTVMGINPSKMRQGVAHFGNWQWMSSLSALLYSATTSTPSSASKMNSLNTDNIHIFRQAISQPLDILRNAVFLHLHIPIACTHLCIPSNEQPNKHFSLCNPLRTVIGQVTGIFGFKLLSVIRTFSRLNSNEMAHCRATSEEYDALIFSIDGMLSINLSIEGLLSQVIQTNENYRISNFIDTRCEIILPNLGFSDDCQIKADQFFEQDQDVPLSATIWTKVTQLFVPRYYNNFKNSVLHGFQMAESLSLVLTIPQSSDLSDRTSNILPLLVLILKERLETCVHEPDDILTAVRLHILEIMFSLKLTSRLLNPTNAPANMIVHQWQLERCASSALLAHDAVNSILILLLGRR